MKNIVLDPLISFKLAEMHYKLAVYYHKHDHIETYKKHLITSQTLLYSSKELLTKCRNKK